MSTTEIDEAIATLSRAACLSMSQAEAATRLCMPLSTLRSAVKAGRVAAVPMSASIRIPVAEVERLAVEGFTDRRKSRTA